MPYALDVLPRARQKFRQLPTRIRRDVEESIQALRDDPYPPVADALRDQYDDIYKIKIDGWRIFYTIDEGDRVVRVINVKRRTRDTYNSLYSLLF